MTRTPTADDIAAAVTRAKREINEDIAAGRVPADVADFSALQDHVDANEYGGLCEDGEVDWPIVGDEVLAVQDALDAWLREGR